MEPEEKELALLGLRINLADQTVYPASFEMHNKCVNMVADLWNAPRPPMFDKFNGVYAGAGTVGTFVDVDMFGSSYEEHKAQLEEQIIRKVMEYFDPITLHQRFVLLPS